MCVWGKYMYIAYIWEGNNDQITKSFTKWISFIATRLDFWCKTLIRLWHLEYWQFLSLLEHHTLNMFWTCDCLYMWLHQITRTTRPTPGPAAPAPPPHPLLPTASAYWTNPSRRGPIRGAGAGLSRARNTEATQRTLMTGRGRSLKTNGHNRDASATRVRNSTCLRTMHFFFFIVTIRFDKAYLKRRTTKWKTSLASC